MGARTCVAYFPSRCQQAICVYANQQYARMRCIHIKLKWWSVWRICCIYTQTITWKSAESVVAFHTSRIKHNQALLDVNIEEQSLGTYTIHWLMHRLTTFTRTCKKWCRYHLIHDTTDQWSHLKSGKARINNACEHIRGVWCDFVSFVEHATAMSGSYSTKHAYRAQTITHAFSNVKIDTICRENRSEPIFFSNEMVLFFVATAVTDSGSLTNRLECRGCSQRQNRHDFTYEQSETKISCNDILFYLIDFTYLYGVYDIEAASSVLFTTYSCELYLQKMLK